MRRLKLPFCDGSQQYPDYPDVDRFRRQIESSAGVLIATPEYHGSLSGVLKNALDLLDDERMRGKIVGLIAVLGGVHSANAINTLRLVCRHLHSWVIPDQLVIPNVSENFNEKGELLNPELKERLDKLIDYFVFASKKFSIDS